MRFMEVSQPSPGQNVIVECMYMHVCVCGGGALCSLYLFGGQMTTLGVTPSTLCFKTWSVTFYLEPTN